MKYLPIAFVAAVLLLAGEARASTSSSGSMVGAGDQQCGAVSMQIESSRANHMSCGDVARQPVRPSGRASGATDVWTPNTGDEAPTANHGDVREFERGNTGGRG